jgi:predicted metal-dependent phosphotriesterase family hydrolase
MTGDEKFASERPDYLLFSRDVVPALLEAGIAQEQIDTMLIDAPVRFFGGTG